MTQKSVLIVDDVVDFAELVADVIEKENVTPIIATSADECLEKIGSPDVIGLFMDIVMPDKDGVELLQEIAKTRPDIPVVLMSGYRGEYLDIAMAIGEANGLKILDTVFKPMLELEAMHSNVQQMLETAA